MTIMYVGDICCFAMESTLLPEVKWFVDFSDEGDCLCFLLTFVNVSVQQESFLL